MAWGEAGSFAAIGATVVALGTLIKALLEYSRQGAQKRAETFVAMGARFEKDARFASICDLLETDDAELALVPYGEKRDFLAFFEEIALMMNSGLISRPVAHYMFGYYAIHCADSKHFWKNVNRGSAYWALFNHFVDEMKVVASSKPVRGS